jgi:hypothetical protein
MVDSEQCTVDGGQWAVDGAQCTVDSGRWTVNSEQCTVNVDKYDCSLLAEMICKVLGRFSDLFFAGKFSDICLILIKLYWGNERDSGALA